jgi:LacI family transcriptional regulator, repressor for deo operon, udp, cdd, tsx, nupC, and nupG
MSSAPGRRQAVRISDVARAAGVSKTLVSYALNDRPGVKESTRAHIVATARDMGWTPSFRARALSASRAYAIGLVLPAAADDGGFVRLLAGLQSVLSTSQYALLTEVVETAGAEDGAYQRLVLDGRVDGLVVLGPRPADTRLALLREAGLAFVTLGRPAEATTMPVLAADESQAIADLVAHLAGLGHRRIAQVGGARRDLCQKFLREHGLDDSLWIEGDDTLALLDGATRPTAIIYPSDLAAVAGMTAIATRGLRVPADISVVGWDDAPLARSVHPALSTVGRDPYEDGRTAATVLLEAIDGKEFREPVPSVEPAFIPRGSTGPAPV